MALELMLLLMLGQHLSKLDGGSRGSRSQFQIWPLDYKLPTSFPSSVLEALNQQICLLKPEHRFVRGQFVSEIVSRAMTHCTDLPDRTEKNRHGTCHN
jgi:hypothetical protein